jgi:hypothetical protein
MSDGDPQNLAFFGFIRERSGLVIHPDVDILTEEFQVFIPEHGSRKKAQFEENLEAVADSEHQPSFEGEFFNLLHKWRKGSDGARPEIVSVGKSSREDNTINIFQIMFFVPEEYRILVEDILKRKEGVIIFDLILFRNLPGELFDDGIGQDFV